MVARGNPELQREAACARHVRGEVVSTRGKTVTYTQDKGRNAAMAGEKVNIWRMSRTPVCYANVRAAATRTRRVVEWRPHRVLRSNSVHEVYREAWEWLLQHARAVPVALSRAYAGVGGLPAFIGGRLPYDERLCGYAIMFAQQRSACTTS